MVEINHKLKEYTREQLRQVRLGIQSGVNILEYAHPSLAPEEMKKRRLELEKAL